jgi:hypothetical protein
MGGMMRKFLMIILTVVAVLVAGAAAPAFATDEVDCTTSAAAQTEANGVLVQGNAICWR